ncbi:MAG: hypothetical protein RLZZ393_1712 [Pseudomonadota bacterium]|jgi:outer membrane protein TolC
MTGLTPRTALVLALLVAAPCTEAQPAPKSFEAVVREHVSIALGDNLALQRQDMAVEESLAALDAVRARYFPEIALNARYTRADGGRQIDFPLGALLNPAYQTLNQLLVAQGQAPRFPSIGDQSFAFQRPREQDTRVTLRQPLYQPAIPAAVAAQRELLGVQRFAREAFARQLLRDVTTGYAQYLKARRATAIVRSALALLDENQRVTDSLFRNGRITQDQVLRARSERLAAEQQLRETESAANQAAAYVNFLLNRAQDTPLDEADAPQEGTLETDLRAARDSALRQRPELEQLDALGRAADASQRIARAALGPQLALGVDAGTQGEQYRMGSGYNYVAASLVLTWKLFDGGAARAEAGKARLAARDVRLQREDALQRVQLEVQQAVDRLRTAHDSLATAQAREEAAAATFRIAARKRDEGAISQMEFLDARNALTSAQLNLNVTRYALAACRAELDHATGSGTLPPPGHDAEGPPR